MLFGGPELSVLLVSYTSVQSCGATRKHEISDTVVFACGMQDTEGLSFGKPEDKMGWNAQPTCSVIMENVKVSAADRLGDEGTGFNIAMNACTLLIVLAASTDLTQRS